MKRNGGHQRWTYLEYGRDMQLAAKAFLKLGLEPLHSVAILGFNAPEWFLSATGAILAGGLACGLYPTNNADVNAFILRDSRANVLVVEDDRHLSELWTLMEEGRLPQLKTVVQYTGTPTREGVVSWKQLMQLGAEQTDDDINKRTEEMAVNQCAVLVYTSGTTGYPKVRRIEIRNFS